MKKKCIRQYFKDKAPLFWIEQVLDLIIALTAYFSVYGLLPRWFIGIPIGLFLIYEIVRMFIKTRKRVFNYLKNEGES